MKHPLLKLRKRSTVEVIAGLPQSAFDRRHRIATKVVVIRFDDMLQGAAKSQRLRSFRAQEKPPSSRHPHSDERKKLLDVQRFCQIIIGARSDATLLIVCHRLGRQHDDWQFLPLGRLRISRVAVSPSISGIITSISTRSILRRVRRRFFNRLNRLPTITGDLNGCSSWLQNTGHRKDIVAHRPRPPECGDSPGQRRGCVTSPASVDARGEDRPRPDAEKA